MAIRVPVVPTPRPVSRRRSLRVKGALVVTLPAVALVGALVALLVDVRHDQELEDSQLQTSTISAAASAVLELAVDAEAGVRGYLATADPSFLASATTASDALPAAVVRLNALLREQEGEEPGADAIGPTVEVHLRQLETLSTLRPFVDRQRIASLAREGLATSEILHGQVADVLSYEQRIARAQQDERAAVHAETTRWSFLIGGVGIGGGIGGSALLMSRIVSRVRRLEQDAHTLAAGATVPARDDGPDEIGSLAAALHDASSLIADQRRRLQFALEVGRINVWEVDPEGRMHMQGDRADEYGVTMESGLATLHTEHAAQVRDAVNAVRRDGEPRDYEVQSARDGRWFAGRVMRSSETDVIAVSVDVTALRRAQDELREAQALQAQQAIAASESKGRLNALVIGSAGEGIVAVDTRGICTSINPAGAAMLGYDVADLVGKNFHTLCHHSYPDGSPYPRSQCTMHRVTRTGVTERIEHEVLWRADGSRLPVEYVASPLVDNGHTYGAVATFTDVTARRAIDAERERQAARLRRAIVGGELVLHYQPKIDLFTGRCSSVESLVRWQQGDKLVYPDEFIPAAEAGGVIGQLTHWVLDAAAEQAANWQASGRDLRVGVNLSALSLANDEIVHVLASAADRHQIHPRLLSVELTETAAATNPDMVVAILGEFAQMGVRTALDDFGTGFSSLSYLKHLPLSSLKIDKSFVINMLQDSRDHAIVASTIHMAHSLGVQVVAEGVENEQVLRILKRAHCDFGQGWLWSKAVEASQLERWLDDAQLDGQPHLLTGDSRRP